MAELLKELDDTEIYIYIIRSEKMKPGISTRSVPCDQNEFRAYKKTTIEYGQLVVSTQSIVQANGSTPSLTRTYGHA
jgi:hypothetical protein